MIGQYKDILGGYYRDILWGALQGYFAVGQYEDILQLGIIEIFSDWASQGYLVFGQ